MTATPGAADNKSLITLEGEGPIRASLSPQHGASLCSLGWRYQGEWRELLYRANQFEPTSGWRGQAPWLWPAVGRNYTEEQLQQTTSRPAECRWRDEDTDRAIPIHGFVMDAAWSILEQNATGAILQLTDDDHTREWYPFAFRLQLTTTLLPNGVSLEMRVSNVSENAREMPFSLGNHLTLAVPFSDGATLSTAFLTGQASRRYEVTSVGFEGSSQPLRIEDKTTLETPWTANAILGGFSQEAAEMAVETAACRLRVRQEVPGLARYGLSPASYRFVLYRDAEQNFFCLEPWLGQPNSLNSGRGLVCLPAGQSLIWRMTLRLEN